MVYPLLHTCLEMGEQKGNSDLAVGWISSLNSEDQVSLNIHIRKCVFGAIIGEPFASITRFPKYIETVTSKCWMTPIFKCLRDMKAFTVQVSSIARCWWWSTLLFNEQAIATLYCSIRIHFQGLRTCIEGETGVGSNIIDSFNLISDVKPVFSSITK